MKQIVAWVLVFLLAGSTLGAWHAGKGDRELVRTLKAEYRTLELHADSLATEALSLAIELERERRADSLKREREQLTERIGPVVSRDPQTKTVRILIDGEPMMAPAVLVEERALRIEELAAVRNRVGIAEAALSAEQLAHQATKRILANVHLQLELERGGSFLDKVKRDAVKIGGGAVVGLIVGFAILL